VLTEINIASGIGLGVVEDLVQKGWNVTIADVNVRVGNEIAARLGTQVIFVQTNVSSYKEQANAFLETWKKWNRLDFVHANAGIVDRTDFVQPQEETEYGAPPQPDSLVVDIDLYGPIWSAYLALHYFRKDKLGNMKKLLITASSAGLYPIGEAPLYSAAKHGAVGLTRSLGKRVHDEGLPITVNCLCPGLVPTSIVSPEMVAAFPKDCITPVSLIVEAVNLVLSDDSVNGRSLECNGNEILAREPPPFLNDAARYTAGGDYKKDIAADDLQRYSERKGKEMQL